MSETAAQDNKPRWSGSSLGFLGWFAVAILAFWMIVALGAHWIAPYPESAIVTGQSFSAGTQTQPLALGSDNLGRDVLSRLIYGARTTLSLALAATVVAFLIGVPLGFLAGIKGGLLDDSLSRINDAFVSFPSIILALVLISAFGSSLWMLVAAVGFIEATRVYRIARSLAQNTAAMDFVEVSRARGEPTAWILWNDIMPNAIIPLSTDFSLRFTYSILLLSALSFLGLGVQAPHSDWGSMVKENLAALNYVLLYGPRVAAAPLLPALCIFSVTLANNLLVDWNLSRSEHDIPGELIQ
ncbi:ABC transporter permease [Mesorhizobium sp.]|uniref:ABC transporter permease n=1 Tax=Mesorhizobium sp. TaxID=1871066 RepID=UPI000FE4F76D|nr:ABC transporter permease [Mesorhizobium sp.]RWB66307.1 MAG: ABC transporter permease [Mesorhizobium sp.]